LLCVLAATGVLAAGCGVFGGGDTPTPSETTAGEAATAPSNPDAPKDPYPDGVLKSAVNLAPPGSAAQFLALLADDFGWEEEINQDQMLRQAIAANAFQERVEPRLLGLFFKRGFSVLPSAGEGHEFSRDSVVRGPVAHRTFLVRAKGPVRIIFLDQADNVVLIYPKSGEPPQVFSRIQTSTVAVRESRSEQYLN
jgi:hypothetical protein